MTKQYQRGDAGAAMLIVERMAPAGRARALPFAHLARVCAQRWARDPRRACQFCPGCACRLVRSDDGRLDLSAAHRLYSACMRPRIRGCRATGSRTGPDSRWKTAVPAADLNKETSHVNRSCLQNEREAGKCRRESRVRRTGLLLLFPGMPSAFHGESAALCACPGGRTARAERRRPAVQWFARSVRGAA